jgi:hypothetical protein
LEDFRGGGAWNAGCSRFFEGRLSKKPPPLNRGGENNCGADGVDFAGTDVANAVVVENEDFGGGCGGADAVAPELGKLRPLKASVSPPNASCGRVAGDEGPPKEGCRLCGGGWDSAFGADAYRERMDCLRSGLDEPSEPSGLELALDGRAGADVAVLPKKSSPRSESPCLGCRAIVGIALLGCGGVLVLSVVLGRTGGAGLSSPSISIVGAGRR